MRRITKLTREEITQFAKTQRQVRFFELMQEQGFELPDDIANILIAIEDAQVSADGATALAAVALGELQKVRQEAPEIGFPIPDRPETIQDSLFFVDPKRITGWASYVDTVYTAGSPFTVASGATVTLPNNAGTSITTYLPDNVRGFYDSGTGKITPEDVGDYYVFTIRFTAESTTGTTNYFDFSIDIGGSIGQIFRETKSMLKGSGTPHYYSIVCPGYTLDTFVANGGLVKITGGSADIEIYDIEFQISRVSHAYT